MYGYSPELFKPVHYGSHLCSGRTHFALAGFFFYITSLYPTQMCHSFVHLFRNKHFTV